MVSAEGTDRLLYINKILFINFQDYENSTYSILPIADFCFFLFSISINFIFSSQFAVSVSAVYTRLHYHMNSQPDSPIALNFNCRSFPKFMTFWV